MAYKTSTGLRNAMLGTSSLSAALAGGFIKIYSGTEPVSADAVASGDLLCTISLNSTATGFTMGTAANGTIAKVPGDVLSGEILVSGTAGYYRHVGSADDGSLSTVQPRIQGRVSTTGAEMNLSNITLLSGETQTVDYYTISLPTF
jgi:hypothetical protein